MKYKQYAITLCKWGRKWTWGGGVSLQTASVHETDVALKTYQSFIDN